MVEIEDRLALNRLNTGILKLLGPIFAHNLLVDGNGPRGIRHDFLCLTTLCLKTFARFSRRTYPARTIYYEHAT